MIDLRECSPSIFVGVGPGIYTLPNESARGKTYLASLLRALNSTRPVDSYTFSDLPNFSLCSLLSRDGLELVLIDRYDVYFGEALEEIKTFGERGVVLVDCKSHRLPFRVCACTLIYSSDGFVVR